MYDVHVGLIEAHPWLGNTADYFDIIASIGPEEGYLSPTSPLTIAISDV